MYITNREFIRIQGFAYTIIYYPTAKKWSGVRELATPCACFRKTKEEVFEWIEKDIERRRQGNII